jgi:hypothetical protein
MKRIYIVLVLLSLFAVAVLTGCGKENPTPPSGGGTNAMSGMATNMPASTNK